MNELFKQRKEIKAKGHAAFRSHYVLLMFVTLVIIVLGVEFQFTLAAWQVDYTKVDQGAQAVIDSIIEGKFDQGAAQAKEIEDDLLGQEDDTGILGRSRGVLAQFMNGLGSGQLSVSFAQTIRSIVRSDKAVSVIFVIASFLWYALIFIFIKNIFSAVARRLFLQARIYENVALLDVTHIAAVRKWFNASLAMALKYLFLSLWWLTIIGGCIKEYSYWAVPYIVAENPSVKPMEAVRLSRKMMDGHKLEAFKFDLTLLGWAILGFVTFGITDMLYGAGYRLAARTEFYVGIREEAKQRLPEETAVLNDQYLFEKADKILLYDTYFEVVDEITLIHENRVELTGVKKVFADWFGIWIGRDREKKAYDKQEGRVFTVEKYKKCMQGIAYPEWLNPLWRRKELEKHGDFFYLRHYTFWTLFLLFILFAFVGWSWEVALHFMQHGEFVNRGTLHGPWLPIYGTGGLIALIMCSRFRKNPVAEFFIATTLCGVLEYFSGWYLETVYHQRWWSYDGYFLNLHGRICAEGLLVFGVGCCLVVYLIAPLFDFMLSKVPTKIVLVVAAVLGVAFGADALYSRSNPNMAAGAIEDDVVPASAEEAESVAAAAEAAVSAAEAA